MVQVGVKVPFNKTNVAKCMCPKCPVQAKSECVKGKMKSVDEALNKTPLVREDIPAVYCSTGTAACKDINTSQSCICGACAVFSQFKLGSGQPDGYFCAEGAAE